MRSNRYILFFALLIGLAYVLYTQGIKLGLVNTNKLQVELGSGIDKTELVIIQGFFSILRKNDGEIFQNKINGKEVYRNGKIKKPKSAYGENDFLVLYANKYYCQIRYFKTGDIMNNIFQFDIKKNGDEIIVTCLVMPDRFIFERKMLLISEAEKYILGDPLSE